MAEAKAVLVVVCLAASFGGALGLIAYDYYCVHRIKRESRRNLRARMR